MSEGRPEEVLTPEIIESVYGVRCSVTRVPETGLLNIAYFPRFVQKVQDEESGILARTSVGHSILRKHLRTDMMRNAVS